MAQIVVLDAETFWSDTYTLSKMTTEAYVRDPRFHAHGVGLRWGNGKSEYVHHADIPKRFSQIDWEQTYVIAHHAQFDGAILNWIYGIRPYFWLDTLSMARAVFPGSSVSLANLCKKLGIEHAGSMKGTLNTKNVEVLAPHVAEELATYCLQDCELTWKLWEALKEHVPPSELKLIDMNIRLFTEPLLQLNHGMLEEALADEVERKRVMLEKCSSNREMLGSNETLAAMFEELGVEAPVKLSPAALKKNPPEEKWVYAFSKSDEEFIALLDHENPDVVALVEARLGVKSTIKETRTQRLLNIAERGTLPVYYNYYGGHTGRFSGGDKINMQNLNRGSKLRESIEAPDGHVLVVRDLSQIEARVLACIAGQTNIVEAFAQNRDVYSEMASLLFGRKITNANKNERFLGKCVILGCGYGLGWRKFQQMIRVGMLGMKGIVFGQEMADEMGVRVVNFQARYGKQVAETLPVGMAYDRHLTHCAVAKHIIDTFRNNNPMIVRLWGEAGRALENMLEDYTGAPALIGVEPELQTGSECIWLPNDMRLAYPHLRKSGKGEFSTMTKKGNKIETKKVYGGLVVENVVQALARIVITDSMIRMKDEGMRVVLMTHDEIVVCAPEDQGQEVYDRMGEIMDIRPEWMQLLPLASEGGFAHNYSK